MSEIRIGDESNIYVLVNTPDGKTFELQSDALLISQEHEFAETYDGRRIPFQAVTRLVFEARGGVEVREVPTAEEV